MNQSHYPRRLQQHLLIEHVGPETLIYDERRHQAFCLDAVSSAVWKNCDGERSMSEITASAGQELAKQLSEETVWHALTKLDSVGLLAAGHVPALSRRTLLARGGATAALAIPVIAMIVAPKAAQAYNGCVDCDVMQER